MQQAATVVAIRPIVDNDIFRHFADALPQIVWMTRPDGYVEYFNQLWYDYTGLGPEGSLGPDGWSQVFHPDDLKLLWQRWTHSVSTGDNYEVEYRIRGRDGQYRWFLGRGLPVRDEQGAVVKWFGTCTDIHDKKVAESQARQREAEFRLLADSLPQIVWIARADGYHEYYNKRWHDYTGLTAEESIGKRWGTVVHPADEIMCWERWQERLESGEPYEIEYRLRNHEGDYRWFLGRGVPLRDEQGAIVKWFGTCTDMHDKILAERQLKQAIEQAEAASMAKTEFLANMSHEIRTPMNAVVGLANILGTSEPLTANQKQYISTLQMSAEQLLQLINDLLDVSRIESNGMHLESIPFDLNRIVQEVLSINTVSAREKHITLQSRGQCRPQLIGDPLRVKQVIMNLVGNAVKFTEEGSVNVNIFTSPRTGSRIVDVMIAVEDTGIGISPENTDAIFGKFSQAETSTTRRFGGSGLGLSIAKTLVELMGGQITVNSKPGKGSCFTVTLALPAVGVQKERVSAKPVKKKPARAQAAETALPTKVLLVEDYHANVLVATMLLQNYGYSYALASSGEEALKKIEEEAFGVVLMDVQMPQMNGYQATALIREREAAKGGRRTPIVGMTAHALKGDRERCIEAGMDDYIAKPFRPETLKGVLEKYCLPDATD